MKKSQVNKIILSPAAKSNKTGDIIMSLDKKLLATLNVLTINSTQLYTNQHLYVLSNNIIKPGDYGMAVKSGSDFKKGDIIHWKYIDSDRFFPRDWKKIIASTDKAITPNAWIPESFIKIYVRAYCDGKPITKVDLELIIDLDNPPEGYHTHHPSGKYHNDEPHLIKSLTTNPDKEPNHKIKINSDGSIILKPNRIYTKRDVIELLDKFGKHVSKEILGHELEMIGELYKWTEEHLI